MSLCTPLTALQHHESSHTVVLSHMQTVVMLYNLTWYTASMQRKVCAHDWTRTETAQECFHLASVLISTLTAVRTTYVA